MHRLYGITSIGAHAGNFDVGKTREAACDSTSRMFFIIHNQRADHGANSGTCMAAAGTTHSGKVSRVTPPRSVFEKASAATSPYSSCRRREVFESPIPRPAEPSTPAPPPLSVTTIVSLLPCGVILTAMLPP